MKIVSPVATNGGRSAAAAIAPAAHGSIRGLTVVFINNGQEGMRTIIDRMSMRLRNEWEIGGIVEERTPTSRAAPAEVLDRAAEVGDFVIAGAAT
jgi:hypothetical protein